MSVQVSARIDEATKQQFDKVCEAIGISPSNVISMLIRGVVNDNGIPANVAAPPEKCTKMSREEVFGCMRGQFEMADDFDAPLEDFREYMEAPSGNIPKMSREEMFDCARGQFNIPDNFDAPLEDFKEYME